MSHFYMPWSYLVALKDYKSRARWHMTAPELQIELQQRLHRTKSGEPVLRYFDAATMISYQLPSRAQETTYCRQTTDLEILPDCDDILKFYPNYTHLPLEYLRVGKSGVGKRAGRGLFATRNIPSYATLGTEKGVHCFKFPPSTWSVLNSLVEWSDRNSDEFPFVKTEIDKLHTYANGYGTGAILMGEEHLTVESSILLFMNHGCNGTYNFADDDVRPFTETNAESLYTKDSSMAFINKAPPFSPVLERHLGKQLMYGDLTLREINEGEELLTDYLAFAGDPDDLMTDALELRKWCTGESIGEITAYEEK
ncbi:hypothetical protein ACHAXA_003625 [Cyclostephanos tholiformis]|uniref:SET domain-containing protein n=1 Tax=Cyclostephanos tholiformis TaxID=382380 RepID=A0ABD3SQC3_9STRA